MKLVIDMSQYDTFDELVEEMFWDDQSFEFDDTTYVYDANQSRWFDIERKYHYADLFELFKDGRTVVFDLQTGSDIIQELEETFYPEQF